jgi:hypothetical protein
MKYGGILSFIAEVSKSENENKLRPSWKDLYYMIPKIPWGLLRGRHFQSFDVAAVARSSEASQLT